MRESAKLRMKLSLIGAVPKHEFEQGLYTAAVTTPNTSYYPLSNNGTPSTATAGAAFPGNDWITYPNGDQYLVNIPNLSPHLGGELAGLRQQHLTAVTNLLAAIKKGNVAIYLKDQFKCPK